MHVPSSVHSGPTRQYLFTSREPIRSLHETLFEACESANAEVVSLGCIGDLLEYTRGEERSCVILNLPRHDHEEFPLHCQLAAQGSPPVVFTCLHGDVPSVVRALKFNPVELLTMPIRTSDLTEALSMAFAQDCSRRQQRLEREMLDRRLASLTPREREVLPLVIGGLLNKQGASILGISGVTFQIHRSQVMRKMQAQSVPDLVRIAATLDIPAWGVER